LRQPPPCLTAKAGELAAATLLDTPVDLQPAPLRTLEKDFCLPTGSF
jgi:hypothetical protein